MTWEHPSRWVRVGGLWAVAGAAADDVRAEYDERDERQAKDDQADQGQADAAASQFVEAMPEILIQGLGPKGDSTSPCGVSNWLTFVVARSRSPFLSPAEVAAGVVGV